MEKYYQTSKTSKTGIKIHEIEDRIKLFKSELNDLRKKYGFKDHYNSGWDICGLIAVVFDKIPDPKLWKHISKTDGYYPKVCNKQVYSDFNKIKSIPRREIDRIIGQKNIMHQCGFYLESEDVYLFVINSEWEITLPEDLVEISNIEYIKYTENKK